MLNNSKMIPKRILEQAPGFYMMGNGVILSPIVNGYYANTLDCKV
jgi:hypothetical protein